MEDFAMIIRDRVLENLEFHLKIVIFDDTSKIRECH